MTRCQRFVTWSGYATLAVLLYAIPGCREEKPASEVFSLEGRIEKISRTSDETGEITVSYYSDKQKADVARTGLVTKSTEIMINGAIATLKDLREGERVRGDVRVEKKGGERVQTVIKINVTRAPATPPGGGG